MPTPESSKQESSSGYAVPLQTAAFALLGGVVYIALVRFGVLPKAQYPGSAQAIIAWSAIVYVAWFLIPPLHRRVAALERRVNDLEKNRADKGETREPDR